MGHSSLADVTLHEEVYVGMNGQNFNFPSSDPPLAGDLYGRLRGDVAPKSGLYRFLTVSEALIGFGILTLAIGYVVNICGVLRQPGVTSAGLLQ